MDYRRFNHEIVDQMKRAREYHFLNMHVYVNGVFQNTIGSDLEYMRHHFPVTPIYFSKDHHVHIFMYAVNIDMFNMICMMKFIHECNSIVNRPVYIHIPKRMDYTLTGIDYSKSLTNILSEVEISGRKLRFEIITEKNSNVTEFNYGDYIPIEGQKYGSQRLVETKLLINWDPHGYARPVFYSEKLKKERQVFTD